VLAGLDSFDKYHALAPNVPALRFRIRPRGGAGLPEQPRVRIEGDHDFILPLDPAGGQPQQAADHFRRPLQRGAGRHVLGRRCAGRAGVRSYSRAHELNRSPQE